MAGVKVEKVLEVLGKFFEELDGVTEEQGLAGLSDGVAELQKLQEFCKRELIPEVTQNRKYKVVTIAFTDKPEDTVRESLRNVGFKWDRQNSQWKATGGQAFKAVDGTEGTTDYDKAAEVASQIEVAYEEA